MVIDMVAAVSGFDPGLSHLSTKQCNTNYTTNDSNLRLCNIALSFHSKHNVVDRGVLQAGDVGGTCGQS